METENYMDYIVPDYYTSFTCKIDHCRSACCDGWPVTFSMADYFKLLSVDCSPELKGRLDISLHLTEHPTEEEYGTILPRYDGRCPIRLADGRCALQTEAGQGALPAVCRLYPRSIKAGECCCSNSCEAVIELLNRPDPIQFQTIRQASVPAVLRTHHFETDGREMDIRLWLIALMQDRSYPLRVRLARLNAGMHCMDVALTARDSDAVSKLLSGETEIDTPVLPVHRNAGLRVVRELLERLEVMSHSIREYGELALRHFEVEGTLSEEEIKCRLTQASPYWESWFENILVNHMFFSQFPFQDRPVSLVDETVALNAVYALLRFMSIGAGDGTHERMADTAAALFRLVAHTAFDQYAVPVLKEIGEEFQLLSI